MKFNIIQFLNDVSEAHELLTRQSLNDPETSKDGYLILTPVQHQAIFLSALTFGLEQQGGRVIVGTPEEAAELERDLEAAARARLN